MSQALQTSSNCAPACTENPTTSIPGTPGAPGGGGTNGTNGLNAYTTLTAQFVMPASLGSVTIDVGNSAWAAINQKIFVGLGASRGTFEVTAKPSATQLTIQNIETASAYLDNSVAGTVFAVGAIVTPSGLQGEAGSAAAGALLAANNLSDVLSAATSRSNLGLGTAAVLTAGVANGNLPPVNIGGGLVNGRSVWATAAGLETKTQLLALAALGVILGTTATNVPPATTTLVNGRFVRATASGVETRTDAEVRTQLGLSGSVAFHANRNAAANQGSIATGISTQAEFDGELFDVGGYFNTVTHRFLPLIAGYYRLTARVSFAAIGGGAATEFYVQIYKTGILVASAFLPSATLSTSATTLEVNTTQEADGAADYFEVFVRQSSGFDATMNGNAATSYFAGELIAV